MTGNDEHILPANKRLLEATRPFARESRARSWWALISTLLVLGLALATAASAPWWAVRGVASVFSGLMFVRAFILYHDFVHGALLRDSAVARVLFFIYGLLALTPMKYWRFSHNFHHANVGKPIPSSAPGEFALLTSDVGSFPIMSTAAWRGASRWQRVRYRIVRHPLTIICAYITVFLISLCVVPLVQDPRKNWQGLLAMLVHGSVVGLVWALAGFPTLLFVVLLPFAIASALGAYFFFAQHNFPEMRIVPIDQWSHYRGALESSSYLQLGHVMRWFTANIGYHHVHHLNAQIPFYRLPEAMAAIPELQHVGRTSLWPRAVRACVRLNLWDMKTQRLVPYRAAQLV